MYYKHPAQWTVFNWKVNHWSPNLNQSTSKNYFKPTIFNICDKFCNTGPITQCQKYLTRNFSFKAFFLHNLFLTLCNKANDPESRNKLHVYVQQNSSSSSYSIFTFILGYWHGWFAPPPSISKFPGSYSRWYPMSYFKEVRVSFGWVFWTATKTLMYFNSLMTEVSVM